MESKEEKKEGTDSENVQDDFPIKRVRWWISLYAIQIDKHLRTYYSQDTVQVL